ncbi:MAG TPA: sigma factor-like helix-turn-helix DNA-binding protein, partial [Pedobacter sp.]
LVQLFCDLSSHFNEINWDEGNSWRQLHKFTKDKLSVFVHPVKNCGHAEAELVIHDSQNGYLERLTEEQKQVFCAVYYDSKTIREISVELNKTDDLIRKTLKEAFSIIRKGGEN